MSTDSIGSTSWWSTQGLASQLYNSFWSQDSGDSAKDDLWGVVAEQADLKVSLTLDKVSDQLVLDLAGVTADYLADKPELAEEYVLVIVEDETYGRQALAYRREDLVEDLEGEERERVLEELADKRLLYHDSLEELPAMPDDAELQGLADAANSFLEQNDKLLNMLARSGFLPWSE